MYTIQYDLEILPNHPILTRRLDLLLISKKKRTCNLVDFAVPEDHGMKIKESEKNKKYLDLAKEPKRLLNKKVMAIPRVVSALGTVLKGLNQKNSRYHENDSALKIDKDT